MSEAAETLDTLRGLTKAPRVLCNHEDATIPPSALSFCRVAAVGTIGHGLTPVCEEHLQEAKSLGIHVARHGFVAAGQSADAATRAFLKKLIHKLDGDCAKILGEVDNVRIKVLAAACALIGEPVPDDEEEEPGG